MLYDYHEICLWLPHKPETVADITADMKANGFRPDRAIVTYEGKILDGRHRYEAALEAGVDPVFTEFSGDKQEAIKYVTSENVSRRHLNSKEKEYFYVKSAEFFGVQSRGGNGGNQYQRGNVSNDTIAPSREQRASEMGVGSATIARWEKDRKEIVADEELAEKAKTSEGYQEAKKIVKKRRATKEEASKIAKLKSLGERSEAESGNVKRKLDKYRDLGVDVDLVESQGEKERAREAYHEKMRPIKEMAAEIAKILIDSKDYSFVASIARAAYNKTGELEHAYNIIKADAEGKQSY
jgi:transcriptional regulator with XRE-family HTH domain